MIESLKDEILSFSRYENNQIIYIDKKGKDYKVKEEITYGVWLKTYKEIPNIKVEGLEDKFFHLKVLEQYQLNFKIKNVHLFYNQYGGFSFPEHIDDIDVFLYVIKGSKKIYIDNEPFLIKEDQAVLIPKGVKHKVDSSANTWALSIGCE